MNLSFAPTNWDAAQSSGHVYDYNILFRKHDRSKTANFFKNNPVVLCIVSCFKKYFVATQLSSLNLDSFIFQLRQWALESQGVSGYIKTLIFGPETSKLRLKYLSRVFFSKQEEPKDGQRQVWQENGFPLIQKLTFCLSELLFRASSLISCWNCCFFYVLKLSWLAM